MSMKRVVERLDEILRPFGFFRHKAVWNRKRHPFVDVIELQKNKSGETVTINAGVLHPDVHRKCWETELPAIIQEPECIVRIRVGQLLDGKDLWWPLSDARISDDVVEKITAYVLPFLERIHSLEAMEQFLMSAQVTKHKYPPPIIYLAILKYEQGDRSGACSLLLDLRKKVVGPWKSRVSQVMEKLVCP